jgi:hypothetical protein
VGSGIDSPAHGGDWERGGETLSPTRVVGLIGPLLFGVALAGDVSWRGVPARRDSILLWIVLGLLALSLTDVRGWARGIVFDRFPLVFLLFAYDLLRGSGGGVFGVQYLPQIAADISAPDGALAGLPRRALRLRGAPLVGLRQARSTSASGQTCTEIARSPGRNRHDALLAFVLVEAVARRRARHAARTTSTDVSVPALESG